MANFLFENNSETEWICIEVITCPNPKDCNNEIGDERYDTFNIPPSKFKKVESECGEICWRYNGGEYTRTSETVISV